jgi:hypothetical protein
MRLRSAEILGLRFARKNPKDGGPNGDTPMARSYSRPMEKVCGWIISK